MLDRAKNPAVRRIGKEACVHPVEIDGKRFAGQQVAKEGQLCALDRERLGRCGNKTKIGHGRAPRGAAAVTNA